MTPSSIIAAIAVIIAGASLIALRLCWFRLSEKNQQLEQQLKLQQAELARVNKVAIGVGRQVLNLQQENKHAAAQPVPVTAEQAAAAPVVAAVQDEYLPYSQANELLNSGESLEQVQQKCRLSKAEAELLALMQSQEQPSAAEPEAQ